MDFEFKKVMSERTDEELIKIVTVDRGKYQPLAIEAAEEEMKGRNISGHKIEEVKEELVSELEVLDEVDRRKVGSLIRFVHFMMDTIIWFVLAAILTLGLDGNDFLQRLVAYVIMLGTFLGYYYVMESKYHKTVAKFVTKTRVILSNGDEPDKRDILQRTLCRLIPFDTISYLFTKNGFHDRLSNTTLIKES